MHQSPSLNKIAVVNKMVGLGEMEPQFIVPQNSTTNSNNNLMNMLHKANYSMPTQNSVQTQNRCRHCENMAKNFLFLESLMLNGYDQQYQCQLCLQTLKYLQYVNKSIMQVFGKYDSIVAAAKEFSNVKNPLVKKSLEQRLRGGETKSKKNTQKSSKIAMHKINPTKSHLSTKTKKSNRSKETKVQKSSRSSKPLSSQHRVHKAQKALKHSHSKSMRVKNAKTNKTKLKILKIKTNRVKKSSS